MVELAQPKRPSASGGVVSSSKRQHYGLVVELATVVPIVFNR